MRRTNIMLHRNILLQTRLNGNADFKNFAKHKEKKI